jgi:uncharacterized protein (TIGR00369 family)
VTFEKDGYQEIANTDNHKCFGCSPKNPSGLRMRFFTDGNTVVSWITVPDHLCGWDKLVHGGVISTILDEIMSWSALYLHKGFTVTKSLAIDFIQPIFIGKEIRAEGKVLEIKGKRDIVMAGYLYDHHGELCAESTGTFTILPPKVAKRMGVMSDESMRDFERILF